MLHSITICGLSITPGTESMHEASIPTNLLRKTSLAKRGELLLHDSNNTGIKSRPIILQRIAFNLRVIIIETEKMVVSDTE